MTASSSRRVRRPFVKVRDTTRLLIADSVAIQIRCSPRLGRVLTSDAVPATPRLWVGRLRKSHGFLPGDRRHTQCGLTRTELLRSLPKIFSQRRGGVGDYQIEQGARRSGHGQQIAGDSAAASSQAKSESPWALEEALNGMLRSGHALRSADRHWLEFSSVCELCRTYFVDASAADASARRCLKSSDVGFG